jgi:hypothetical protein
MEVPLPEEVCSRVELASGQEVSDGGTAPGGGLQPSQLASGQGGFRRRSRFRRRLCEPSQLVGGQEVSDGGTAPEDRCPASPSHPLTQEAL